MPKFPITTKTLTYKKKIGYPFAIMRMGNSIWNRVSLHNIGIDNWISLNIKNVIVSIAGEPYELDVMVEKLNSLNILGIELNYSCPNHKKFSYKTITTKSKHPLYLKLRYTDNPYTYNLDIIKGIRLNSIPAFGGGMSGKYAQKYNWQSLRNWLSDGLSVAGCSFVSTTDLKRLEDMGCLEVGIGSSILINPKLIEKLT
jgi:dihydroorotate dehydrogenase